MKGSPCRWPCERSDGEALETADGEQLVDIYVFSPDLYESGGIWLDEELQACLPLHVTFREADQVDDAGWARVGADKDLETADVLLYAQNRCPPPPTVLCLPALRAGIFVALLLLLFWSSACGAALVAPTCGRT